MVDEIVMTRARYEAPRDDNSWIFMLAGGIAVAIAAYLLTRQAYALPLGDTTPLQSLATSLGGILMRLAPLMLVAGAGMWILMVRLGRKRLAPLAAAAMAVCGLIGSGSLIGLTALEKTAYERDFVSLRRPPAERIGARYQQALFHSYNAFYGRLDNLFAFSASYRPRPGTAEDVRRARAGIETARQSARNFEAAVADNQARALADVQRTSLSRYGKAQATADLQALFAANAPTVERITTLNSEIIGQVEDQVGVLERTLGRWNVQFGLVAFRNQSDLEAFRAAGERLPDLEEEAITLMRQLGVQADEASGPSA